MKKKKVKTVSYVVGVDCSLSSPLIATHFIEEEPADDIMPEQSTRIQSSNHGSSYKNTNLNTGHSNHND